MSRMLVISNRLPFSLTKREGKLHFKESVGGLATGLGSFYRSYNSLWIGWSGTTFDNTGQEEHIKSELMSGFCCLPVFLSKVDVEDHYNGYCNRTIWPLFHYFPQHIV